MSISARTIIHPVTDLEAAKAVYTSLLGVEPYADSPYYVGYRTDVGDTYQELGLDPNGHAQGMTGPVVYWHVADLQASYDGLLAAGATSQQAPHDVGGGQLIATLTDADGNLIGLRAS